MIKRFLASVSLFTLLGATASAQIATTTALVGTITDASGNTVPTAKVTAVNSGTHDTYSAVTNEQGFYNIQFIALGDYNLTVEQPGFQVSKVTGIHVDINQVVRTDVVLRVSNVVESVTVQATAAIKTDDATVSEIISTRNVADSFGWPRRGRRYCSVDR
jgi:hypothetical protein